MSKIFVPFLLILLSTSAGAQIVLDTARSSFQWVLPLAELPFDIKAAGAEANRRTGGTAASSASPEFSDFTKKYKNLSMDQATDMSRNLHGSLYYLNNLAWNKWVKPENKKRYMLNRVLANTTALATDYLATKLPYGYAFQHEEFHRSVMSIHGIYSYDEVWDFGKGLDIAVTGVKDEDLIYLKKQYPASQVRLSAAGVEGEYFFFQKMRTDNFFYKTGYPFVGLSILGTFHGINYVKLPLTSRFNEITDSILSRDKFDVLARDFTGYDFSAWVYDLFTPEEPYADRGTWPDGIGIKRPVKESDLSSEMKSFLKKTSKVQYLNLISPFNIGINRIKIGENLFGNFALRSVPTSFGYFAGGDFFIEKRQHKLLISAGINKSNSLTLPDLQLKYYDYHISDRLQTNASAAIWLQPAEQRFFATTAKAGFSIGVQPMYRISDHMGLMGEMHYKTKGWQFGNPYLNENFSASVKLSINTTSYFNNNFRYRKRYSE